MADPTVDSIPVTHTPPDGYGRRFPDPILAGCRTPLVDGAPDLRGLWQTIEVQVDGEVQKAHPALGHLQRIEQAGDRLIVTGGGVIHDMRCDGTVENGVHDVAEFDKKTAISVVATFEDGVHVLRPVDIPIEVKRWRDGPHMMWQYIGLTARLARLGPPPDTDPETAAPARTDPTRRDRP